MKKIILSVIVCFSIFTSAVAKDVIYHRNDGNITVVSHDHDWSGNHTVTSRTMNQDEYNNYSIAKGIGEVLLWILKAILTPNN